jgi:hypothetical protein
MERALYNTVLAGMSQDGKSFFYVNPLEVWPEASYKNHTRKHVLPCRPSWFGCACCPPNVARLLASLGQYVFAVTGCAVYVNLFAGCEMNADLPCGPICLRQTTAYPRDGRVRIDVLEAPVGECTVAVRMPGWCKEARLAVNGSPVDVAGTETDGYIRLPRTWIAGDCVELDLVMNPVRMLANPAVRADAGRVAVQCGPLVYCLEECDNGSGLHRITLPGSSALQLTFDGNLLGGANMVYAQGFRQGDEGWGSSLYQPDAKARFRPVNVKFIPYYLWANREPGEMTVWVREG